MPGVRRVKFGTSVFGIFFRSALGALCPKCRCRKELYRFKVFFSLTFFSFSFLSFQHTVALSVVPPCALVLLLLLLACSSFLRALSLAARELPSPRRRIRTYTYAAEGITSVSLGLWEAQKLKKVPVVCIFQHLCTSNYAEIAAPAVCVSH